MARIAAVFEGVTEMFNGYLAMRESIEIGRRPLRRWRADLVRQDCHHNRYCGATANATVAISPW